MRNVFVTALTCRIPGSDALFHSLCGAPRCKVNRATDRPQPQLFAGEDTRTQVIDADDTEWASSQHYSSLGSRSLS